MSNTEHTQTQDVYADLGLDEQEAARLAQAKIDESINIGRKIGIMAIEQMLTNPSSFSTRCG